jgi:hypothetical protein
MTSNLRTHEIIGLTLQFLAGTLFGVGMYIAVWGASRPIFYGSLEYLIQGKEFLMFPLLFGTSAVLWSLGAIELKEALPGKNR